MAERMLRGRLTLDHIGIAVADLPTAERLYTTTLGGRVVAREELDADGVGVAFVTLDAALIELLAPSGAAGPLARFLAARGEGLHHLAFEVGDLEAALREAAAEGLRLVDARPRRGTRGRMIAFLHPSAARGVLIELVQRPER
jgi:methylmalonyl-CoA epimerase